MKVTEDQITVAEWVWPYGGRLSEAGLVMGATLTWRGDGDDVAGLYATISRDELRERGLSPIDLHEPCSAKVKEMKADKIASAKAELIRFVESGHK